MKKVLYLPLVCLGLLGLPARVLAHAVETNYLMSADELEMQAIYSTGEPLSGVEVQVFAPGNTSEPWMTGTTDAEGRFSFLPDGAQQGEWQVDINMEAEDGHGDSLTVPVGAQGIEMQNISQAVDEHDGIDSKGVLGAIAVIGMLAVDTFLSRRKS